MLTYILFILGFVLLIKGASWLVKGASSLADKLGISALVIGLTIVSFGTSAPELLVNVIASLRESNDIVIGTILGSNISNIFLILGISAIICPLIVKRGTIWKEIPLGLLAVVALSFMANDVFIDGVGFSQIGRIDGLLLLLFFIIFMYYTYGIGRVSNHMPKEEEENKKPDIVISVLFIIIGSISLALGAHWLVDGAIAIARIFGISEALIAVTVVAIGTSLPELATSAVAAFNKNVDIAVGNIVGSNIFNIFWILGISTVIRPANFSLFLNADIFWVMVATFLLFLFMFIGKRHTLQRWQGSVFVGMYLTYIIYAIYRG